MAETTNGKWKETQINGKAKTIFKLVRFSKFSLYWSPGEVRGQEPGAQGSREWRLAMRDVLEAAMQGDNPEHGERRLWCLT
jgi:hypothetical protein